MKSWSSLYILLSLRFLTYCTVQQSATNSAPVDSKEFLSTEESKPLVSQDAPNRVGERGDNLGRSESKPPSDHSSLEVRPDGAEPLAISPKEIEEEGAHAARAEQLAVDRGARRLC